MRKHTPAPWYASDLGICDSEMCDIFCREDMKEAEANIALAVASPDLLEALEGIVERVEYFHNATPTHLVADCFTCQKIEKAKAAIAKAEGRS